MVYKRGSKFMWVFHRDLTCHERNNLKTSEGVLLCYHCQTGIYVTTSLDSYTHKLWLGRKFLFVIREFEVKNIIIRIVSGNLFIIDFKWRRDKTFHIPTIRCVINVIWYWTYTFIKWLYLFLYLDNLEWLMGNLRWNINDRLLVFIYCFL